MADLGEAFDGGLTSHVLVMPAWSWQAAGRCIGADYEPAESRPEPARVPARLRGAVAETAGRAHSRVKWRSFNQQ